MATSQVGICNMALGELGKQLITSLLDTSPEAIQCNLFWDQARENLLREYPWSFAKRNQTLTLTADPPVLGWQYIYAYPADCLLVRRLYSAYSLPNVPDEYETALSSVTDARVIYSNTDQAYIEYTARIVDPTLFDPTFVEAFKYKLASLIAKPLTGNDSLSNDMLSKYQVYLERAKLLDAAETYRTPLQSSRYYDVR
jgi:hypothetical protein